MNIGLVVEGLDDYQTYPSLIRRIRHDIEHIYVRSCGGIRRLRNKFVYFLKEFQSNPAHLIVKAIVVRDSDCNDAHTLERELEQILELSGFRPEFPVHFHATKCKLESLLLADEDAISHVAQNRGKVVHVGPSHIALENSRDADTVLSRKLGEADLPADSKVFSEIAAASDLAKIVSRCPHFRDFSEKILAC